MKLTVVNEDGSNTVWIVHVHRDPPKDHQDHNRYTVCALHTGDCIKAEQDDRAECVHLKRARNAIYLTERIPLCGWALCNQKDNFSRSLGRKIAFTKAISALNQPERKRLWIAYWAVVKMA